MMALSSLNFTDRCWQKAQPTMKRIYTHPFIAQMKDGSLPYSNYLSYLREDALYLEKYAEVFTILSQKVNQTEKQNEIKNYLQHLSFLAQEEAKNLHFHHIQKLPNPPQMNSVNKKYTNHLLKYAQEDLFLGLVAALPCSWVYAAVGQYLVQTSPATPASLAPSVNPYIEWIQTYASPKAQESNQEMIALVNELAKKQSLQKKRKAQKIFLESVEWEYQFWGAFSPNNESKTR